MTHCIGHTAKSQRLCILGEDCWVPISELHFLDRWAQSRASFLSYNLASYNLAYCNAPFWNFNIFYIVYSACVCLKLMIVFSMRNLFISKLSAFFFFLYCYFLKAAVSFPIMVLHGYLLHMTDGTLVLYASWPVCQSLQKQSEENCTCSVILLHDFTKSLNFFHWLDVPFHSSQIKWVCVHVYVSEGKFCL